MAGFCGCRGFAAKSPREAHKFADYGPIGGLAQLQVGVIAKAYGDIAALLAGKCCRAEKIADLVAGKTPLAPLNPPLG